MKYLLLIFIPSLSFGTCQLIDVLPSFAPADQWSVRGNTYQNISWLSQAIPEPTLVQVNQAIANCLAQPTLDDRVSALETATQAIATKTGTVISLPDLQVQTP